MGFGDVFAFYDYKSDNGVHYAIRLSQADAASGGFTAAIGPLSLPGWPWNHKDLRHVTGKETGGTRNGRLVIQSNTFTLYQDGGSWTNTVTGVNYTAKGAHGENRPASHLGG